jgi:hypothetical protein
VAVAMREHPKAVKVSKLRDSSEVLRNIHGPRNRYVIDALSGQLVLFVSKEAAKLIRDFSEPSFESQDDSKLLV